jgi:hypothetical protein
LLSLLLHMHRQGLLVGLGEGRHQVFDRWSYSGVVYSAANGLPLQWCKDCEAGLPKPDLVVLLSVDPATAAGRGGYSNERYERLELQEKVRWCCRVPLHLLVDRANCVTAAYTVGRSAHMSGRSPRIKTSAK